MGLQHAVNAQAHHQLALFGLQVNVRRARIHRAGQNAVEQLHHRRLFGQLAQVGHIVARAGGVLRLQLAQRGLQVVLAGQVPHHLRVRGKPGGHGLAQGGVERVAGGAVQRAIGLLPQQQALRLQPAGGQRAGGHGLAHLRQVRLQRGGVQQGHGQLLRQHGQQRLFRQGPHAHQHGAQAAPGLLLKRQGARHLGRLHQALGHQQLAQHGGAGYGGGSIHETEGKRVANGMNRVRGDSGSGMKPWCW